MPEIRTSEKGRAVQKGDIDKAGIDRLKAQQAALLSDADEARVLLATFDGIRSPELLSVLAEVRPTIESIATVRVAQAANVAHVVAECEKK